MLEVEDDFKTRKMRENSEKMRRKGGEMREFEGEQWRRRIEVEREKVATIDKGCPHMLQASLHVQAGHKGLWIASQASSRV